MYAERHVVSLTTAADGSATAYSPPITGRILGIRYLKPGSNPLDNGADATITLETTGEAIVTLTNFGAASGSWYPRVPTQDETGADALYAAGGAKVRNAVLAVQDRLKIVIAQGGNVLNGTFHVIVG